MNKIVLLIYYVLLYRRFTVDVCYCALCVARVAMRKRGSNDDVIIRRPVNDHVIKMASAKADDGPNTVRIRVIVPDIKFQVDDIDL